MCHCVLAKKTGAKCEDGMWMKMSHRARTRSWSTYRYQGRSRLISLYIPPTPRDRPVEVPILGVRPADEQMYDPMLGEWPVEDRIFEGNTLMRPDCKGKPGGNLCF